jgi:hypothetical protein
MIKNIFTGAALGGLIALIFAACAGSSSNPSGAAFSQIELLSRPAVKEAFENFTDHDTTNRTEPYNDATLDGEIGTFSTTVAGRSAATAAALQSILYPNEMKIDLSQSATTAAYLGVETGGETGSKFGGRGLTDDTIDVSLGAIFGTTLSALGVVPADGKQSPCLSSDNVPAATPAYAPAGSFPYSQGPV